MISKRLEKAITIQETSTNFNDLYIDSVNESDKAVYVTVKSSNSDEEYYVSLIYDLWRCSCSDFYHNGLHKEDGSFLCKHIIATILHLGGCE